MTHALILDGQVAETRDIEIADIPPHKRALWLPVTGDPPQIDARSHLRQDMVWEVTDTEARRTWALVARPLDQIKAESLARIVAHRLETQSLAAVGLGAGAALPDTRLVDLYATKQEWARLAKSIEDPDAIAHLTAEAAARGLTVAQLADLILAKAHTANGKVAAIECLYATAVSAVMAAGDSAAALAAEDTAIAAISAVL